MSATQGATSFRLSIPEVLASVRSLYADELKPFGRVLLKRLRERAAAVVAIAQGLPAEAVDPETMPRIDPKRLRRMCQTCPQLRVDPEDGREFSVTLVGRPCSFLDVCSPHDPYLPEMWLDAASYFQSLSEEEMYLPGGRYACARVLASRGLPFLAGCSLGQACHIVQLAISQKRILGYLEGQLVPYWHSEEWVKEQYAFHQQPLCSRKGPSSLPLATWDEARERLLQLLDSESNPEPGVVTLSNVKRLFRSRFQLELSETALGHSRLFDLLHDVRFRDVCTVQAHGNGQLLVKRADGPRQIPCHQLGLQDCPDSFYQVMDQGQMQFTEAGCVDALQAQAAPPGVWNHVFMGSVLYPQVPMDQMCDLPPNLSTLREVQIDMGMETTWHYELPTSADGESRHESPCHSACQNPWQGPGDHIEFVLKGHEEEGSGWSTDAPVQQPDALRDVSMSGFSSDDADPNLALQAEEIRAEEDSLFAFNLCATLEKWPINQAGRGRTVKNSFNDISARVEDSSSPSGRHVKNTFIDISAKLGDSSPRRRRQSVPKDMYSQRDILEATCHALMSPAPKQAGVQ